MEIYALPCEWGETVPILVSRMVRNNKWKLYALIPNTDDWTVYKIIDDIYVERGSRIIYD